MSVLQLRARLLEGDASHRPAEESSTTAGKNWTIRLVTLWLVICALMFLRRPDSLTNSQFWAEDGVVFFTQQITAGFINSVFQPYAGYLHVIPRLIAFAASFFPLQWAPFIYDSTALLLCSLCCTVFAGPWCRNLLRSDGLRVTSCLIVATGLQYGSELVGVVANVQWFLAVAAIVLIFSNKRENAPAVQWIALSLIAVLIGLSAPETFVVVPFLVWQTIRYQNWRRMLPAVMLTALFVQLWLAHATSAVGSGMQLNISDAFLTTVVALISRPVTASLLGHSYLIHNPDKVLLAIWTFVLIAVSVWLALLSSSVHGQRRRTLWGACYIGVAAAFVPVIARNFIGMFGSMYGLVHVAGERYFLLSAAMFVFLVAFSIEQWITKVRSTLKVTILLAIFLLGIINNFRVPRYKDMHWSSYVPAVQQWSYAHQHGIATPDVTVPINPPGWQLSLPRNLPSAH